MQESEQTLALSRRQLQAAGTFALAIVGGYLGAWMYLDGNFDYNREQFIAEAELTRAQVVNQADWIRAELLNIVTACVSK